MPNLKCYTREKSDGKKYVHCSSNPIKKGKKKRKTVKKPKLTVVDKIAVSYTHLTLPTNREV